MPESLADRMNQDFIHLREGLTDSKIKGLEEFRELSEEQQVKFLEYVRTLRGAVPVLNYEWLNHLAHTREREEGKGVFGLSQKKKAALDYSTKANLGRWNVELRARVHSLVESTVSLLESGVPGSLIKKSNEIIFDAYGSTPRYATNGESRNDQILAELSDNGTESE